jgi:hypothetical protein
MPPSAKSFQTAQDSDNELSRKPAGIPDGIVNEARDSRAETQSAFKFRTSAKTQSYIRPSGTFEMVLVSNALVPMFPKRRFFLHRFSRADIFPPSLKLLRCWNSGREQCKLAQGIDLKL